MAKNTLSKRIPIYHQSATAVGGIDIAKISEAGAADHMDKFGAHRDDFFIFFVLLQGNAVMKCDMVDVAMDANGICMLKPFQVHSAKHVSINASGYYISAAPFLIPNDCADVFQNLKIADQASKIGSAQESGLIDTVALLHHSFRTPNVNKAQIINGLFSSLVYRFAEVYQSKSSAVAEARGNQSWLITVEFKKLIAAHSFLESPSFFAKKLNISTSHLNDCVSASTGRSVTAWLQNAMSMEAQRLLYYTEKDVKEIAYHLGFEDHTYFSRLFKKITGETPLAFRKKFRE